MPELNADKFKATYSIRYRPANHFVIPSQAGDKPYFSIVDDQGGRLVAMALVENDAQTVCLALDLLTATVKGDRSRIRELSRLIDALKGGFN